MKKPPRKNETTGCATPSTAHIKDLHAERVVLAGLLRLGRPLLDDLKIGRGDFYHDTYGLTFDLCCYAAYGSGGGPLLADAYLESVNRGLTADVPADFLALVWFTDPWFATITDWADHDSNPCLWRWCALAAAAKIRHLAARRAAIYAANEIIRDAIDPTGDAEDIRGRTDGLLQGEY